METTFETSLNRDDMEKRRLEAVQDLLEGLTQSNVARKFGVSRTTASRWNRALQQKGVESLRKRRATGRPSRLSREQLLLIPDIFAQGAIIHGFADNRWTTARLASVIEARFGVHYDHDHVGRRARAQRSARQPEQLGRARRHRADQRLEIHLAIMDQPQAGRQHGLQADRA